MLNQGFYFDDLTKKDKQEIIEIIFEAHSSGFTSEIEKPKIFEIENAVERRFKSFGQTNTLYMSNVVKNKDTNRIVGVCIAGIYPDSENYSTKNFATIHQVSVKPEYQRKGIAKGMILRSINESSSVSPVITLGVMIGNPAKILYKEIGFKGGPIYTELKYKI
jgi:ribosomal protein S18 acetylase RimI-like enzyme